MRYLRRMTTTPSPDAPRTFSDLGLGADLLKALDGLGYEEPTPIQDLGIPHVLAGSDVLGLAATGTGKTAAFTLPMLERITKGGPAPSALILVPTRELAVQVAQAAHRYGREMAVKVLPIYGGQSFGQQLRVLRRGVDVVVATPGRALDHIRRGTLDLVTVEMLVLDEADEMLDMGFAEDLDAIVSELPETRQTLLFSATLGPRITRIAGKYLNDPVEVRIADEPEQDGDGPRIEQRAYLVRRPHKLAALGRVLDMESPEAALVFCRTRNDVDELVEALNARGYRAEAMHGGMSQDERERVMKKLRAGTVDLLVATDVAARGLDISHLTHVVNYDVPNAPKSYVHRIGRVGRAGREGVAITLADPREHGLLRNIERLTRTKIAIDSLPTVADMRAHRMEQTRVALRETLLGGDLDRFRVVVESLNDEFDLWDIAVGAVKMAHEATLAEAAGTEEEIPTASAPRYSHGRGTGKGERRGAKSGAGAGGKSGSGGRRRTPGMVRLFVGAGRQSRIRPGDLVGAITGEAGISGSQIGTIYIADKYSLVEIAEGVSDQVYRAMKSASIKGRRVKVKMDGS
ncbi:MAG: DEAD/DEAH box helicase [Gemmatimonadetes bacterium]|nr:DEAD/DEAH box helicase [Gemmatimonadota bacterium]MBT8404623.1 DEAD/DEAH box helicase [Gemmatimonadota bacterium]NNK63132.1 DEAD/DEAH box helicase [Gemmatimonadota bacterium]